MHRIYYLFIFLFLSNIAFAAYNDTSLVKKNKADIDSVYLYKLDQHSPDFLDSSSFSRIYPYSLNNFEDYKYNGKLNNLNLGNWGTQSYSSLFQLSNLEPFAFMSSLNLYDKNQSYFTSDRPFTALTYSTGMKKEQTFNVLHTQNFSPTWNIMLNFFKINSVGFYNYQKNDHTLIRINTHYLSQSGRLSGVLFFKSRSVLLEENGGLEDMNSFLNDEFSNYSLYETNLNEIENHSLNKFKTLKVGTDIRYHFSSHQSNDSTLSRRFKMGIGLNSTIQKSQKKYEDVNSNHFYANSFIDTAQTYDFVEEINFDNGLYYFFEPNNNFKIDYKVNYQSINYNNLSYDSTYDNIYNKLNVLKSLGRRNRIKLQLKYFFYGYNKNDYSAKLDWKYISVNNKFVPNINFIATSTLSATPIYYQTYQSNHFKWQNDFNKIETKSVSFCFNWPYFNTNLNLYLGNIKGLVYFDEYSLPRQFNGSLNYLTLTLKNKINMGRVHLMNRFVYQSFDQTQLIPLPNLIDKLSIYYKNYLFKKKMLFKVGASAFIYSKHYGYAFMPSTSAFHLQNNIELGNYPYADVFVSFKIRRFKAMIKYAHFNSLLTKQEYIQVPLYPSYPAAIEVKLSWAFLN